MKYHDNSVYFSIDGGFSLISGNYTVDSFSVTDGQDPKHHIYIGLPNPFVSNGEMTFSIGRHGSDDVADWFKNRIPSNQTTFNQDPGKLNFAFIGTLTLTIQGMVGGQHTFTFENVGIAQGAAVDNNWWFGGQNCSYIGNNRVVCKGVDSNNLPVEFVFRRGGNEVNNIEVTHNLESWMGILADNVELDQIMMPGSHDAGMSELHHCCPGFFAVDFSKTQYGSIGFQLSNGSRYFDIRVDYDYDKLVTYHRSNTFGCNGQDLKDIFDEVVDFLNAHNTETVIFKFSHIRDYEEHHASDTKNKINDFLKSYSSVFYTNTNNDVNLATLTLGELRGKLILVFEYSEHIDPSTGRFRYEDGYTINPEGNLTVYDEYSETDKYSAMKSDQLQKWDDHAALGTGHFFLLSWTLTATFWNSNVKDLAIEANSKLPGVLYDQIITAGAKKPNIVYIDFLNSEVAQSIVQYNF